MGRHLNGYAERGQNIDHPLSWEQTGVANGSEQEVDLWSLPENAATADIEGLIEGATPADSADSLAAAWMGALARSGHAARDIDRARGRDGVDDTDPYADFRSAPSPSPDSTLGSDDDDYTDYTDDIDADDYTDDYTDDYADDYADTDRYGTGEHGSNGPPPGSVDRQASPDRRQKLRSPLLTVLIMIVANTAAGLVTLLLINLVTPRADLGEPGPSAPAIEVDDRVVVPGTAVECATMLVKPRPDGNTGQVNGTCFAVG